MRFLGKNKQGEEIWGYDFVDQVVKSVSENEIEIIGSTEDLDRDREVIKMDGWDLKNYKKNPVVLASHMYYEPPIGRATVKKSDGKLVFKIEFPPEGDYPLADVYRKLYKGDFMRASSVGFIPKDYIWGERENDPRRTILKQELLEISLVSVPANPQALVTAKGIEMAVKKGVLNSRDVKCLQDFVKNCFQEKPEDKKLFFIPGGDSDDGVTGKQSDLESKKSQDNPEETKKEENQIFKIENGNLFIKDGEEFKEISSFLQSFKTEIIESTVNQIKKDSHYINHIISDPVPEGTTGTIKQLNDSIKKSFKGEK